jgi:hypothetical protein
MEHNKNSGDSPIENPNVDVRDCAVGKGVFSKRTFRPDWVIGEITGRIIYDSEYGSNYCIDLEDGRALEPVAPFRYLNHSCEPNCEFDMLETEEDEYAPAKRGVFLMALHAITEGDQLTIDYNWPAEFAIRCYCQAPTCRGWIVQEDELDFVLKSNGP